MHQTINLWESITRAGTTGLNSEHQARIIVVNTLSLITALLASTMGTAIFIVTGDWGVFAAAWLEAAFFSGFIFLNYRQYDRLVAFGFMLSHSLAVLYFGMVRGMIAEEELLTIFLVLVSLLIFNGIWQSLAWGLVALSFLCIGKLNQRMGFYPTEPLNDKGNLFHDLGAVAILFMIFTVIFFYKKYWTVLNAQLDRINKDLEAEVERKTAELRIINTDLQIVNSKIRKFTEMFAHDVRDELFRHQGLSSNMITAIEEQCKPLKNFVDESEHLPTTVDIPTLVSTIHTLHEIGNNVGGLIGNALDLRRIEAGTFGSYELETISVKEWCFEQLRTPKYAAHRKCVEVELSIAADVPEYVSVGRVLLERALKNLLSNAIKFTPENGQVTLRVLTNGKDLLLDIIDQGPGVREEDYERIFRLYETDGRGTGLGLYIALSAVTHLGGEIMVSPGADARGTIFRIGVPLRRSSEPMTAYKNSEVDSWKLKGLRCLVIDDNKINRMVLSAALKKLACEVYCADSGMSGLKVIEEQKPELVLMDANMPGMSGMETLAILRSNTDKAIASTPVLMVTANDSQEQEQHRGLYNGILYKPYSTEAFIEALLTTVISSKLPSIP
nr:hybrid sensor histidine kinase/response regulator [uncultured Chitinophaga sp.]